MKINHDLLGKIYIISDTHAFHVNITRGTTAWTDNGTFKTRDFDHWKDMTECMAASNSLQVFTPIKFSDDGNIYLTTHY